MSLSGCSSLLNQHREELRWTFQYQPFKHITGAARQVLQCRRNSQSLSSIRAWFYTHSILDNSPLSRDVNNATRSLSVPSHEIVELPIAKYFTLSLVRSRIGWMAHCPDCSGFACCPSVSPTIFCNLTNLPNAALLSVISRSIASTGVLHRVLGRMRSEAVGFFLSGLCLAIPVRRLNHPVIFYNPAERELVPMGSWFNCV
jgi:hypothetical protein